MTAIPETAASDTDFILDAILEVYRKIAIEDAADEGTKLRASALGGPCERAIWYSFRWATPPVAFSGRMTRLFDTGKREEIRVLDDLRRAGIQVWDSSVDKDGHRVQFSIEFAGGHGKGSVDGVAAKLPRGPDPVTGLARFFQAPHLLEIKTHNLKSFADLKAKGLRFSKPQHYSQMQLYMRGLQLDRGLYWATCKDDDYIYLERVRLDGEEIERLDDRANRIVFGDHAPAKAFDNPDDKAAWICRQCSHENLCQRGEMPIRRNCRTCLNVTPKPDGVWLCQRWGHELDEQAQRTGCEAHLFLPELVPAEQVDAAVDRDGNLVVTTYKLATGELWIDSVSEEIQIGIEASS